MYCPAFNVIKFRAFILDVLRPKCVALHDDVFIRWVFCIHVTALYVLTFLPWILISTLLATVSITPIWTPSKAKKVSMMGNRVHTGIMVKHRATEMTHSSNIIVQSYLKGEAVDVLKQSCLVKALLAIFLMLAHVKFWMSSSSSRSLSTQSTLFLFFSWRNGSQLLALFRFEKARSCQTLLCHENYKKYRYKTYKQCRSPNGCASPQS